jgi:ABC-type glycerol-3-phosphate transport system substrate-binding protein
MQKKLATWLAAFLLSMNFLLMGCKEVPKSGPQDGGANREKAETVSGNVPLQFTFFGNYDWYTMQPWGEDPATKWIEDNKNVKVDAVPSGGASQQKFNTMLASDQLPDVIFTDRGPDVERLRRAGKLVPLDPYLEKFPNLKKWASSDALNLLRSDDGKLYQFPNWYTTTPTGNGGYIVNDKIYREFGSPKLETFTDLYAYLAKVKDKHPELIPFEVSIQAQGVDILYSGFANDHPLINISNAEGIFAVPDGNRFTSIFTDPVYKEAMQFASKLYREKLVPQDALTQTLDQVREKVAAGKVAIAASFNVIDLTTRGNAVLKEKDPNAGYSIIWPLHKEGVDKNKVWPTQYDSLGWNVNVITTNAKNPEGIYAYLDWLTGEEGQRIITWGPEGLYWQGTDEKGAPKFSRKFFEDGKEYNRLYGIWDSFTWVGNTNFQTEIEDSIFKQYPSGRENWAAVAKNTVTRKTSFNATPYINLEPQPESEEGLISQKIKDIYKDTRARMLYAKNDEEIAALLEKAEKDSEKAGYSRLLAYKTNRWQQNLKKLNQK